MSTSANLSEITAAEIAQKVSALEQALHAKLPNFPILLRDIHKQLSQNPDCVTLLKEEEIGIIIRGLEEFTQVRLITDKVKKAASSPASVKKQLASLDLDKDL